MTSTVPLLSLESAAMLCRVDPRGRWGLLFRRRVGPLLFRAGGREPRLLPFKSTTYAPFPRHNSDAIRAFVFF